MEKTYARKLAQAQVEMEVGYKERGEETEWGRETYSDIAVGFDVVHPETGNSTSFSKKFLHSF